MESIWNEWKEHYKQIGIDESRICKDGIANPEMFKKEKLKILFIGKEVNDWPGGDMRSLARSGPKHSYLYNLGRWAAGLIEGFPEFEKINNRKSLNSALNKISLINLKKTSGGASSNMATITAYAKNDKKLLVKQIRTIHPNIIVPLATHEIVMWLLDLEPNPERPDSRPYYCSNNQAWILPWKHPSMRGSAKKPYDGFYNFLTKNEEFFDKFQKTEL